MKNDKMFESFLKQMDKRNKEKQKEFLKSLEKIINIFSYTFLGVGAGLTAFITGLAYTMEQSNIIFYMCLTNIVFLTLMSYGFYKELENDNK